MRRFFLMFVMLLFVSIISGGCGGGGGSYSVSPDVPIDWENPQEPHDDQDEKKNEDNEDKEKPGEDNPSDDDKKDDPSDDPSDDNKKDDPSDDPSDDNKKDDPSDNPSDDDKKDDPSDNPSDDDKKLVIHPESADFWRTVITSPDQILFTEQYIAKVNETIRQDNSDLRDLATIDAITLKESEFRRFGITLYTEDGIEVDEDELIAKFEENKVVLPSPTYALTVRRSNVRYWPTERVIRFTADDRDDELQIAFLEVGEPMIVTELVSLPDGSFYAYGIGSKVTGWVKESNLCTFDSREEWLEAWNSFRGDDFLVVTERSEILETADESIEVGMGTRLAINGSSTSEKPVGWTSYICYVPARNEEKGGSYIQKIATLPKSYQVSVGWYLLPTPYNFVKTALEMLGNKYSWGSKDGNLDESAWVERIYATFGIQLPLDLRFDDSLSQWKYLPETMTSQEKMTFICGLTSGNIIRTYDGTLGIYLGNINGKPYILALIPWETHEEEEDSAPYVVSVYCMSTDDAVGHLNVAEIESVLRLF